MDKKTTKDINKFSMACEVDGKCYYVSLPQSEMRKVFNFAAELSKNGALELAEAPEGTHITGGKK